MSWALEDWVAGLSGRALQKVRELQDHQERLQRERQQRQVQLDNAEAALNKQKLKYEEVRAELVGVQRDLQSTQEEVQAGARVQDRLIQELQVKQAQVCSLQGQLDSAHSLSHSLSQEVKRLKAELEKLQNASSSGDSVLFSTPYWNMSTPQEHNRSWWERDDGHGGGADGKHVRQLQFLDCSPKAVLAGASPLFPRQRHSTLPSRCSSSRKDHSTSSGVFPWEREEASSVSRGQPATLSPSGGDVPDYRGHRDCGKEDLSNENEIQRSQILKLQTWVQSLEQEIRLASDQLRESETRLAEVQGDLAARDQNLNQAREELDQANTRIEKERDRAQMAEQQVKQLQDELSCQRQNAESSRRSAEQRRKDLEREHQKELSELEKERHCMERQHQQESSKLNQELQQARTLHNTLQAQYDKMLLQKQSVEKYLDNVKGKLEWTEKELQEAQKKETQTQSKLMEALRERDSLSVNMEQSSQRVRGLEEEVKRLTKELAAVLSNLAEVQAKPAIPAAPVAPVQFTPAGDNFLCSVPPTCDRRHCPPHAQRKKAERQNRVREEDLEHRVKYLADRMPCEGIDSEHTGGFGPSMQERPRGERGRGRCTEDGGGSLMREEEDERGENKKCSGICETGVPDTRSKEEDDTAPRVTVKVQKQGCSNGDADTPLEGICTSSGELHNMPSLEDLRKENVGLWDKLREAERKLELRLEDLQTQRMAESEARTKLKQLSHKHSSQAEQLRHKTQELWEEGGRLEKQLEEERSKSSRLTEALATLELDFRKEQVEREKEKAMEKAKSDKLTADMAVLESELRKAQEGRERERKEEERQRLINEEHRRAVMERLIELEMELEEWRGRWQNVNDGAKKTFKLLALGYSTNENFNKSDITFLKDNDVIPFPHECPPISDSANQQKTLETGKINSITKEAGHTVEPPRQKTVADLGTPLIERGKEEQMKLESATDSDEMIMLLLEVEQLRGTCEAIRGERDQEAGRAKQAKAERGQQRNECILRAGGTGLTDGISKGTEGAVVREQKGLEDGADCWLLPPCSQELATHLGICAANVNGKDQLEQELTELGGLKSGGKDSVALWATEAAQATQEDFMITSQEQEEGSRTVQANAVKRQEAGLQAGEVRREDVGIARGGSGKSFRDQTETEDKFSPSQIKAFQQQLVELQSQVSSLRAENSRQEEELELWRLMGGTISSQPTRDRALQPGKGSIAVVHEDHLLLTCKGNKLVGSTLMAANAFRQSGAEDNCQELLLSASAEKDASKGGQCHGHSHPAGGTPGPPDDRGRLLVAAQESFMKDLNSKTFTHKDMEKGTKIEEKSNDVGHQVTITEHSAEDYKEIQYRDTMKQTKTILHALGDDWARGSDYQGSDTKAAAQRIPGNYVKEPCCGEDQSKTEYQTKIISRRGHENNPLCIESWTRKEQKGPESESASEQNKVTFRTSSGSTSRDEGKAVQITTTISVAEDTQIHNFHTETLSENKTARKNSSPYCMESETTAAQTLMQQHKHLQENATDMLKLAYTGEGSLSKPVVSDHSALSWMRIDAADVQTQTEVQSGSLNFRDMCEGGDWEGVTCMWGKSVAIQTEGETGGLGFGNPAASGGSREVCHTSVQTEALEIQELHDSVAGKEVDMESTDSLPLSPTGVLEGGAGLLFSRSVPIPADPARLAQRIRQNRNHMSAAFDDTEYEPYGLPEVVMKGFADIPSGPACPYVLRRGLLGMHTLPLSLRKQAEDEGDNPDPNL